MVEAINDMTADDWICVALWGIVFIMVVIWLGLI